MGCEASKRHDCCGDIQAKVLSALPAGKGWVKPLIICGPSGSGKRTFYEHLKSHYHDQIVKAVSCTTRVQHQGEVNGVDYIFIDTPEFKKQLKDGAFFEHSEVAGNFYGIHLNMVTNAIANEKIMVMLLDIEGAK